MLTDLQNTQLKLFNNAVQLFYRYFALTLQPAAHSDESQLLDPSHSFLDKSPEKAYQAIQKLVSPGKAQAALQQLIVAIWQSIVELTTTHDESKLDQEKAKTYIINLFVDESKKHGAIIPKAPRVVVKRIAPLISAEVRQSLKLIIAHLREHFHTKKLPPQRNALLRYLSKLAPKSLTVPQQIAVTNSGIDSFLEELDYLLQTSTIQKRPLAPSREPNYSSAKESLTKYDALLAHDYAVIRHLYQLAVDYVTFIQSANHSSMPISTFWELARNQQYLVEVGIYWGLAKKQTVKNANTPPAGTPAGRSSSTAKTKVPGTNARVNAPISAAPQNLLSSNGAPNNRTFRTARPLYPVYTTLRAELETLKRDSQFYAHELTLYKKLESLQPIHKMQANINLAVTCAWFLKLTYFALAAVPKELRPLANTFKHIYSDLETLSNPSLDDIITIIREQLVPVLFNPKNEHFIAFHDHIIFRPLQKLFFEIHHYVSHRGINLATLRQNTEQLNIQLYHDEGAFPDASIRTALNSAAAKLFLLTLGIQFTFSPKSMTTVLQVLLNDILPTFSAQNYFENLQAHIFADQPGGAPITTETHPGLRDYSRSLQTLRQEEVLTPDTGKFFAPRRSVLISYLFRPRTLLTHFPEIEQANTTHETIIHKISQSMKGKTS